MIAAVAAQATHAVAPPLALSHPSKTVSRRCLTTPTLPGNDTNTIAGAESITDAWAKYRIGFSIDEFIRLSRLPSPFYGPSFAPRYIVRLAEPKISTYLKPPPKVMQKREGLVGSEHFKNLPARELQLACPDLLSSPWHDQCDGTVILFFFCGGRRCSA